MEWLRRVLGVGRDGRDTAGNRGETVGDERKTVGDERETVGNGRESGEGEGVAATANDAETATDDVGTPDGADGATTTRPRGQPHPPGSVPQGVALFVDGPNVLRDEFDVDLDDVRAAAADAGPLVATRLYLDEHAPPGLIQAAEARGYRVVTTSGDVDVRLAVDVARFAAEGRAATVAVASRDTDFKPAVEAANEYGLATLAIAPGSYGRSDALRNAVDRGITLEEVTTD
jgi:uncharacterized protein (TIGR00288 family)